MITINNTLVKRIAELKKLNSYIAVVVDYKKEAEYSDLNTLIVKELQKLSENFTPKDIASLINCIDEESKELYLYDSDEIIEVLFPSIGKKNTIIQSAYNWMESKNRIEWILNNVLHENKYYDVVNNVNNNYIISTKKLSNII